MNYFSTRCFGGTWLISHAVCFVSNLIQFHNFVNLCQCVGAWVRACEVAICFQLLDEVGGIVFLGLF